MSDHYHKQSSTNSRTQIFIKQLIFLRVNMNILKSQNNDLSRKKFHFSIRSGMTQQFFTNILFMKIFHIFILIVIVISTVVITNRIIGKSNSIEFNKKFSKVKIIIECKIFLCLELLF